MKTLEEIRTEHGVDANIVAATVSIPVNRIEDIAIGDYIWLTGKNPLSGHVEDDDKDFGVGLDLVCFNIIRPIRDSEGNWLITPEEFEGGTRRADVSMY